MLSNVHEYVATECYKGQHSSNSGKPSFITEVIHSPTTNTVTILSNHQDHQSPLPLSELHQTRPLEYKSPQTYGISVATNEVEVHSQMKVYLGIITWVAAAAFIPVIAGLTCDSSSCAVCFKDNDPDLARVKFSCPNGKCADACPATYHGLKCTGIEGCK